MITTAVLGLLAILGGLIAFVIGLIAFIVLKLAKRELNLPITIDSSNPENPQ
jgi:hypothetical protein